MPVVEERVDVVVVGAGHAGCEAAAGALRWRCACGNPLSGSGGNCPAVT